MTARSAPPAPLTRLEIASGVVVGTDPGSPPLPRYGGGTPRAALEAAVLPALVRGPCVVSFSGGRDSSAVLAIAAHVARREGLPLPIPVTIVFPDNPQSHEHDWQELVVAHLGLREWQRIPVTAELDLLGPFAQAALRAHGPLFPFNGYTYAPMFPYATGGTMLTGLDGDGLLARWTPENAADVLARRRPATPRDVLRVGLYVAPEALRRAYFARSGKPAHTWLTPSAEAASRWAEARELAAEPLRWDRRVAWWQARRYLSLSQHYDDLLAGDAAVTMLHPLLDPVFLASLAHTGGTLGPGDRTTVMRMLLSDLLPDEVLSRSSKAGFNASFFHRHSREFVARWDGSGVDRDLVDPVRLRATWTGPRPSNGAASLLQATWLATEGSVSDGDGP